MTAAERKRLESAFAFEDLTNCRNNAFGANAEGVEKNGGGTGSRDARDGQLLQQQLFARMLSEDRRHGFAQTTLGVMIFDGDDSPSALFGVV